MPKTQLAVIVLVSAFFYLFGAPIAGLLTALSAAYGGAVSWVNTWLLHQHTNKQWKMSTISPQMSVGMMLGSVLMRMTIAALLILVGIVILELHTMPLIVGFILGQVGFLIDRVKQI